MKGPPVPSPPLASRIAGAACRQPSSPGPLCRNPTRGCGRASRQGVGIAPAAGSVREVGAEAGEKGGAGAVGRAQADDAG